MLKRLALSRIELAAAALLPIQAVTAWLTWRHGLPGPIAVHFNLHGQANGWADRQTIALIIVLTAGYFGCAIAWLGRRRRASIPDAPSRRLGFAAAQLLLLGASAGTTDLLAGLAGTFGEPLTPFMILTPICLAFIAIGGLIGRVPPNAFVGLRTPWALASRLAWDRSNRLFGRLFLVTGCVALLSTAGSSMAATVCVLAAGGTLAALCAAFESWRVWRGDPARQ